MDGGQLIERSGGSGKGDIFYNAKWQFNMNALYELPLGIQVGGSLFGRQGYARPFVINARAGSDGTIRVLATPDLDDNRYPSVWDLDLRVAKTFTIYRDTKVELAADIFNVLNNDVELTRNSTLSSGSFDTVGEIIAPRIMRLGLRSSSRLPRSATRGLMACLQIRRTAYGITGRCIDMNDRKRGRYRQFFQLGVETYGMAGPDIDAELILIMHRLWQRLGIRDKVRLQINSLGTIDERSDYRENLLAYFKTHIDQLDADSLRRLETNPLRILDTKNPAMKEVVGASPVLMDYLGDESRAHFEGFKQILVDMDIAFEINPRLERGLDYYCNTVFEWVTEELGSQGTVCAGGRYDGLIEQLGGKASHAVGFAMGIERLLALVETMEHVPVSRPVDVYLIRVGDKAEREGLRLAEAIRNEAPALKLQIHCGGGSF